MREDERSEWLRGGQGRTPQDLKDSGAAVLIAGLGMFAIIALLAWAGGK